LKQASCQLNFCVFWPQRLTANARLRAGIKMIRIIDFAVQGECGGIRLKPEVLPYLRLRFLFEAVATRRISAASF
jgi:hypothetical protein